MDAMAGRTATGMRAMHLVVAAAGLAAALSGRMGEIAALEVSVQTEEGEFPGAEKLPLLMEQVEVSIHDQVAGTHYWFHFRNDFETDLEVTCQFALGVREFVESFSYYNGDEKIVGEVLEKEAAERVYQELTNIQRDPGILEQTDERFRFRVYPVQPGEVKPIELTTLSTLESEEGVIEYRVPQDNLPSAESVFSLLVEIHDDLPIAAVETVGFQGSVVRLGPKHYRVTYEGKGVSFGDDLRIRYRLESADHSLRFVTYRQGSEAGTFMLLISPKASAGRSEALARDIVFVIDVSGSMEGEPLEQTKWALTYILGELAPQDRFDIIAFDDAPTSLLGGLREAAGPNVTDGIRLVSDLKSRGGTNILEAMRKAMDSFADSFPGRSRAVVFLTDGQGTHPASEVVAAVRQRDLEARVYTFGVGNGVNRAFLERLARDNRGTATIVNDSSLLESEMRRLFDRISVPLMVNLDVEMRGAKVEAVYPNPIPDLYADGEVVLFGRYDRPGKARVIVTGQVKGEERGLSLDVTLPAQEERYSYIEKLWATRRIEHLADLMADQGASEELTNEITRLGIVYNLVTPYTTFLAVPESLKTDEIKEMIRQGSRGYDKRLIDSIEGIKLSMTHIPPGDPVLTVDAPADAFRVTAYFPFGLTKRLAYDPIRRHWSARFLVPRDVADGLYEVRVHILYPSGLSEWRTVEYFIDSAAPEFEAEIPAMARPGALLPIEVDPFEAVAEVQAYVLGVKGTRTQLRLDPETGAYVGALSLPDRFPEGPLTVRVVVRDLARNRFERDFEVWESAPEEDSSGDCSQESYFTFSNFRQSLLLTSAENECCRKP
jgi:Ca-activated chloride channel family protein